MKSEEVISKNRQPSVEDCRFLAAELGFEPRQTESESAVLPLHNSATNKRYYTHLSMQSQVFFAIFLNIFFTVNKNVLFSLSALLLTVFVREIYPHTTIHCLQFFVLHSALFTVNSLQELKM